MHVATMGADESSSPRARRSVAHRIREPLRRATVLLCRAVPARCSSLATITDVLRLHELRLQAYSCVHVLFIPLACCEEKC
jgi:hypothetical protein